MKSKKILAQNYLSFYAKIIGIKNRYSVHNNYQSINLLSIIQFLKINQPRKSLENSIPKNFKSKYNTESLIVRR